MKWTANTKIWTVQRRSIVSLLSFLSYFGLFIWSYLASMIIKEPEGIYYAALGNNLCCMLKILDEEDLFYTNAFFWRKVGLYMNQPPSLFHSSLACTRLTRFFKTFQTYTIHQQNSNWETYLNIYAIHSVIYHYSVFFPLYTWSNCKTSYWELDNEGCWENQ